MYKIDGAVKRDPVRRWHMPDRIFFACGACHILTWAFLDRYPDAGFRAFWIRPAEGFYGNHILAVRDDVCFDYRGYQNWERIQGHTSKKANQYWPGWSADIVELPSDVLISEQKSRTYDGLWLREPGQYLRNALPRARTYLDRYPLTQLHPTHAAA